MRMLTVKEGFILVVSKAEMYALEVSLEIAQGGDDPDPERVFVGATIDSLIKDFAESQR